MQNEPIKHDKSFPPSASAGGENAYYLKGCDTVQRSPAYASCLFKIAEYFAGRHHEIYRDCNGAIEQKRCKAMEMKQEEELKGQALYFFPRKPPQALTLSVEAAGEFGTRISNLTPSHLIPKEPKTKGRFRDTVPKSAPKPAQTALDRELAQTDGYAAAINAAIAEPATIDMTVEVKRVIEITAAQAQSSAPATQGVSTARPPMQAGESPLQYARRLAANRNQPQGE